MHGILGESCGRDSIRSLIFHEEEKRFVCSLEQRMFIKERGISILRIGLAGLESAVVAHTSTETPENSNSGR